MYILDWTTRPSVYVSCNLLVLGFDVQLGLLRTNGTFTVGIQEGENLSLSLLRPHEPSSHQTHSLMSAQNPRWNWEPCHMLIQRLP
jgi:hypothetical protein